MWCGSSATFRCHASYRRSAIFVAVDIPEIKSNRRERLCFQHFMGLRRGAISIDSSSTMCLFFKSYPALDLIKIPLLTYKPSRIQKCNMEAPASAAATNFSAILSAATAKYVDIVRVWVGPVNGQGMIDFLIFCCSQIVFGDKLFIHLVNFLIVWINSYCNACCWIAFVNIVERNEFNLTRWINVCTAWKQCKYQ